VPERRLLRKVDHIVDFGFIRNQMKHLYYYDNGRPALDGVSVQDVLVGYLY